MKQCPHCHADYEEVNSNQVFCHECKLLPRKVLEKSMLDEHDEWYNLKDKERYDITLKKIREINERYGKL